MFGGKPFVSGSVQFAPDDLFLLVTDGVLEVTNAEDEEFGLAGVKARYVRARRRSTRRNLAGGFGCDQPSRSRG